MRQVVQNKRLSFVVKSHHCHSRTFPLQLRALHSDEICGKAFADIDGPTLGGYIGDQVDVQDPVVNLSLVDSLLIAIAHRIVKDILKWLRVSGDVELVACYDVVSVVKNQVLV